MNEKLQYATMLEIPVSTCSVTFQQTKRKKQRRKREVNPESVKQQLMNKINVEEPTLEQNEQNLTENYSVDNITAIETESKMEENSVEISPNKKRWNIGSLKVSVIGVQLVVIGILVATIFLTNAFYADSGINVFMRQVFGGETQTAVVDQRGYEEFNPVLALDDAMTTTIEKGVINFEGTGSVYAPCDGKVSSIIKEEDGKYTLEIAHSDNFKTTVSGLDFAYAGLDEQVYANIPLGYVAETGATMCFIGEDGAVISNYEIVENSVVWAV